MAATSKVGSNAGLERHQQLARDLTLERFQNQPPISKKMGGAEGVNVDTTVSCTI